MSSSRDLLASVAPLCKEIAERAAETGRERNVPRDIVDRLRAIGVYRMLQPSSLGGLEVDPCTAIEVIETIAHADGSTGWSAFINTAGSVLAWLDQDAARALVGPEGDGIGAGVFAPVGRAIAQPDGSYRLTGRWSFNSGCLNADWLLEGGFVIEDGRTRLRADGLPDWRFFFFPAYEATIHDTWYGAGLEGTGSHDVEVRDLVVTESYTAMPMLDPPRAQGPLYQLAFFSHLAIGWAGIPLGIVRRALDEFESFARTSGRGMSAPLATSGEVQMEVAASRAALEASKAYVHEAVASVWTTACSGMPPSTEERARVVRAVMHAAREGQAAVQRLFWFGGGRSLLTSHPLQRCLRDLTAMNQHLFFSPEAWKRNGKAILGEEFETYLL
jgi:alkylation response protein AidB-like acyl-CoA dehydrogenase